MKYIIIVLALITFQINAQTLQELEQKLEENLSDSVRLKILEKLATNYLYSDNAKARKYTEEAMSLSEAIDQNWASALGYNLASNLAIAEGNFSAALKYDNLYLQLVTSMKDSIAMSAVYNRIGFDYSEMGYFDEAYNYFTRAFKIARSAAKNKKDSLKLAIPLHNLGRLFKDLDQFDRAVQHLKIAQKISDVIGDEQGIAYTLDELGDIYMRVEDYDLSLETFTKAMFHAKQLDVVFLMPRLNSRIAEVYSRIGKFDIALAYYDTARHLQTISNNTYGIAEVELGTGIVNLKKGNEALAEALFLSSLEKARALDARMLEIKVLEQLGQLREKQGKYKEALEYFKQHEALEDELFSLEMQNKLSQDQIRFETEGKDFLIEELIRKEAEQDTILKRQEFIRNVLVVLVAMFGILLFTLYRSGQRGKQINKLLMEHQEEMEKRSKELEELNEVKDKFFSIISHDLRSPMNALSALLDLVERGQVSKEEFEKLIKELRRQFNHTKTLINNLLDWALLQMDKLKIQPDKIYLKQMVDDNFKLLDSLQIKSINLKNNIDENSIGFADPNTINLVFRNLIMNAMKFTEDGGQITVDASRQEKEYIISVQDTGIGINKEIQSRLFDKTTPYSTRGTANEKGSGLGLILCKEFVEKNGGKIWVESEEGKGSIFKFTLKSA